MHKEIDFTQQGGYPFSQNTLAFLQDGIKGLSDAIVGLVGGGNVIISGCEVQENNQVSAGWVVYNGELLPCIGGNSGFLWKLVEDKTALTFYDGQSKEVQFSKYLQSDSNGDIDSSIFKRNYLAPITTPIIIDVERKNDNGDVLSEYYLEIYKMKGNYVHITGYVRGKHSAFSLGAMYGYEIELNDFPYRFDSNDKKGIGQSIIDNDGNGMAIKTMILTSGEHTIQILSENVLYDNDGAFCQIPINGYFKIK